MADSISFTACAEAAVPAIADDRTPACIRNCGHALVLSLLVVISLGCADEDATLRRLKSADVRTEQLARQLVSSPLTRPESLSAALARARDAHAALERYRTGRR